MGLIRIKATGETFRGIHEPVIAPSLYHRVQSVLHGKTNTRTVVHDFLYRRLFSCSHCQYSLIGELQKGHIYYRCHTKGCPTTAVREEMIDKAVNRSLRHIELHPKEKERALFELDQLMDRWESVAENATKAHNLSLDQLDGRLNRLTDAFLEGHIDKETYLRRKEGLLNERSQAQEHLSALTDDKSLIRDNLTNFLELAERATVTYRLAVPNEKREMIDLVTSNRTVDRKNVAISHSRPFEIIAARGKSTYGDPYRDIPRTGARPHPVWKKIINQLAEYVRSQRAKESEA